MVQGSDPGERFRRRALRRGYKVDEVDEFLDRVDSTLMGDPDGPPISAEEVHNVVFRVRFGGYDEWEVDKNLDRVERQLAELDAQQAPMPTRQERREPAVARAGGGVGGPALMGGAVGGAAVAAAPVANRAVPSPARAGRGGRTSIGRSGDDAPTQYVPAVRPSPYGDQQDSGPDTDQFDTPSEFRDGTYDDGYGGRPDDGYRDQQQGYQQPRDYDQGYQQQDPYADQQGFRDEPPAATTYRGGAAPAYAGGQTGQQPAVEEQSWAAQLDRDSRSWEQTGPAPSRDPGSWDTGATVMWNQTPAEPHRVTEVPLPGRPDPGRHGKSEMTAEMPQYGMNSYTPQDAAKVDQLRSTFKQRRFGSGYDVDQVDRLFDGISALVTGRSGGRIDAEDLVPHFELVQGGYYEDEVDAALGEVRDLFGRRG